jgi:hypothetical protein
VNITFNKWPFILPIVLFIVYTTGVAQEDEDEIDLQTWFDFRAYYQINESWLYDGDYGIRGLISKEDWKRFYINPSFVYYYKTRIVLRGGMRFIYTLEELSSNTFELRPWQGIRIFWPGTSFLTIDHYFRLEQRLTFYTQESNSDFAVRGRYRIQLKTPKLTLKAINQTFYFLTFFEIFGNLGNGIEEKYVNRNRLNFGMGYYITSNWWLELDYIRQSSRRGSSEGFKTTEHIFRLRLKVRLK